MIRAILLSCLLAFVFNLPAASAASTAGKTASKKTTTKSTKKAAAKKAPGRDQTCRTIKVKTSKGTRTRRVCSSAPAAALRSPIDADALHASPREESAAAQARAIARRAYAVDGNSFFHEGRKYRVAGLEALPGEMGTQRLQKALDAGALSLAPLSSDDNGEVSAVVRVNGQNIADTLRLH